MKYTTYISVIFYYLFCNVLYSQAENNVQNIIKSTIPEEKIKLHVNTDLLFTGETLYYNLFCQLKQTNTFSNISKIAYVEFIGDNNNTLFKHKLRLKNGLSNGRFFIPAITKTGNYKLIAYTQWMKNNSKDLFFQKDIYIINPYIGSSNKLNNILEEGDDIATINFKNLERGKLINSKTQNLSLETDLKVYKTRSKVGLEIKNSSGVTKYGNYSLSVRKLDDIEIKIKDKNELNNVQNNKNSFYLPELRGEIVSGYIVSKQTDSVLPNKYVTLSIPGKNYVYKNVITDETGYFYFNLYENYTNSNVIIQVVDANNQDFKIVLSDKSFKYSEALKFKKIYLNENIKKWMVSKSISNQIENAYISLKRDSVLYNSPVKPFYGKPTITYNLDDYKRFPSVRETFIEIIEGAAIRKIKGNYSFIVYQRGESNLNTFSEFKPLVIVDGLLIQDNQYQYILDYNAYKIESISYLKGIYFNGPSVFDGVIDIITKNKDFILPTNLGGLKHLSINVPQQTINYYTPNYDTNNQNLKRIPDYRSQLLWNPSISLQSNKKSIEFYTSDLEGVYEIVLEGYTLNGNYIISKEAFEVKNN